MNTIYEAAYNVEHGRMEPVSVTLSGAREAAKLILEHFDGGQPFFLRMETENELIRVLDVDIPMGPMTTTIHNGYLPQDDLDALRVAIENAETEESVDICFRSSEDHPIIVEYSRWPPQ